MTVPIIIGVLETVLKRLAKKNTQIENLKNTVVNFGIVKNLLSLVLQ